MIYLIISGIILLTIIALACFANGATRSFLNAFDEINKNISSSCISAYKFAEKVNSYEFSNSLQVMQGHKPGVSDCYHTKIRVVELSKTNYGNASVAALSVVAHELGHAIQERDGSKKLKSSISRKKMSKFLCKMIFPLCICGVVCFVLWSKIACLILFALAFALFLFAIFAKISTHSMEKEASKNAMMLLKKYAGLEDEELDDAKFLLKKASNTYLSDVVSALLGWTGLTKSTKLGG